MVCNINYLRLTHLFKKARNNLRICILTVSVIAILLTAPLGAFGIDLTYQKFLKRKQIDDIV